MPLLRRQLLYVDAKVQSALLARTVLHWACCVLFVAAAMVVANISGNGDSRWWPLAFIAVTALALLPLMVFDTLRISSRFIGPMARFRHAMRALARGERAHLGDFRGSDYWRELADDFNSVAARIEQLDEELQVQRELPSNAASRATAL